MASSPITNEQAVALGLEDGSSGSASSPIPHQQAVQLGLEDGLPSPPGSDSFVKGALWTGSLKPLGQGIAALGSVVNQRGKEADAQLNAGGSWGGPEEKIVGDILGGIYNPMEAEWGKALQAQREGRGLGEFMYRGLAGSIPILGPMLGKALDTGLAGHPKEAIGQALVGAPLQFAVPELVGRVPGVVGKAISKAKASPMGAGVGAALGKAGMAAVGKNFPIIGPAIKVGLEAADNAKVVQAAGEAARPGVGAIPGAGDLATQTAAKLRMMQAAREAGGGTASTIPGAGDLAETAAQKLARVRQPVPEPVIPGGGDAALQAAEKLRLMKAAREAMPGSIGLEEGAGSRALAAAEKLGRVRAPVPTSTATSTSLEPGLPPPPIDVPAPPVSSSGTASYPQMTIQAELPKPPSMAGEIGEFADFIKNTRKSNSNPSPWADPEVLQQEAVNAALDANKRVESQGAGQGSGFEPGLDQPTPRWNPLVNKITDPALGKTIEGTFDPRTGSVVRTSKTLPKPPEFATFEPDELMSIPELQKRLKGKQVQGANTLGKPEANLAKLERLNKDLGAKAVEGQVTPVPAPEGGLYLLYKHKGKITDYALLEEGPEGVVLQERVRGGKADPKLESPGMDAIKDALWSLRNKFKVNPSSMSEGALKSWMKYKPKKS